VAKNSTNRWAFPWLRSAFLSWPCSRRRTGKWRAELEGVAKRIARVWTSQPGDGAANARLAAFSRRRADSAVAAVRRLRRRCRHGSARVFRRSMRGQSIAASLATTRLPQFQTLERAGDSGGVSMGQSNRQAWQLDARSPSRSGPPDLSGRCTEAACSLASECKALPLDQPHPPLIQGPVGRVCP